MIERDRPHAGAPRNGVAAQPSVAVTIALGLTGLFALPAFADEVDDIHAALRAAGTEMPRSDVLDLYRSPDEPLDLGGIEVTRGIRYGVFEEQSMDLYVPTNRSDELVPVVVFVHGGNLDNGDREDYGNVAAFFARQGFIGVNANYRLVPAIVWPQGAEDMREILGWLWTENAESYGGDPNRVFLIGHVGGARHVASVLFHRTSQMVRGTYLGGAILVSPLLGPSDSDAFRHYYGDAQEEYSPVSLVESYDPERPRVPMLLLSAEFDPPHIELSTADMYAALCQKYGSCPKLEQLRNHNRFSAVVSFDTVDETVSLKILDFIREINARPR